MSFRFKDSVATNDAKLDDRDRNRDRDRMMALDDKLPRDARDDLDGDRGPRGSFGRGRRPSPPREKSMSDRREFDRFGRDDMPPGGGRDRSPLRGRLDDRRLEDRFSERERLRRDELPYPRRDDRDRDRDREHRDRPPLDDDIYRDKFMGRLDDRARFDGPGGLSSRYDRPDDPLMHRPLGYPSPFRGFLKSDTMRPNECEIIVVNKQQRAYAESLEARLKNIGIQVDLLFLKDEALLAQTIDDIARRGSLYAIVIGPLNETHRSVTLNILYGTPQEHRNMPLDDSLKLMARNFHDHIRTQQELMDRDKTERSMMASYFPADREIQFLLRLLADGQKLSLGEIETVIRYLTERRDKMKGITTDTNVTAPSGSDVKPLSQSTSKEEDLAKKEKELQNRIMHIMEESSNDATKSPMGSVPGLGPDMRSKESGLGPNVSGAGSIPSSLSQNKTASALSGSASQMGGNVPSSGANSTSTPSTYINFDNPSVKKALDSLMQSGPNLLKSLASTTAPSSQSIQSTPSTEQSVMGSNIGMQRDSGNMVGMGPQRGRLGNMGDIRSAVGGMSDMGQQRGGPPGMGDMGLQRGGGASGMSDMNLQRGLGVLGDMGQQRGLGGLGDMGPQRGLGSLGDMNQQRGQGGIGDMGSQRGPGGMGDMGSQRGPGGMGDMGSQRGPGGMGDMAMRGGLGNMGDVGMRGGNIGDMGFKRGPVGMNDMGPRGLGGLSGMDDRGQDVMGNQRGPGGNMNMQRGGGIGEGIMGLGMGPMQDPNNMGMGGRPNMGPGPRGMGPGSQFQGSQGMFGGNIPNMIGNRPPFMGGRRY